MGGVDGVEVGEVGALLVGEGFDGCWGVVGEAGVVGCGKAGAVGKGGVVSELLLEEAVSEVVQGLRGVGCLGEEGGRKKEGDGKEVPGQNGSLVWEFDLAAIRRVEVLNPD